MAIRESESEKIKIGEKPKTEEKERKEISAKEQEGLEFEEELKDKMQIFKEIIDQLKVPEKGKFRIEEDLEKKTSSELEERIKEIKKSMENKEEEIRKYEDHLRNVTLDELEKFKVTPELSPLEFYQFLTETKSDQNNIYKNYYHNLDYYQLCQKALPLLKQKKLEEVGLKSKEEISIKQENLKAQISKLKSQFLGSFRNRKEIRGFEEKINKLDSISYSIEHSPVSPSKPDISSFDYRLDRARALESSKTLEFLTSHFDEILEKTKGEKQEILPSATLHSLNKAQVEKKIEEERNYARKRNEEFKEPTQEEIENCITILSTSSLDKREKMESMTDKLPNYLQKFILRESTIRKTWTEVETPNDIFKEMAKRMPNRPLSKNEMVKSAYSELLNKLLKEVINEEGVPSDIHLLHYDMERKLEEIQLPSFDKKFIKELDIKKWMIFKENKKIQEIFGKENLEKINNLILKTLTEELYKEENPGRLSHFAERFYYLGHPDSIKPLYLIGLTGDYPAAYAMSRLEELIQNEEFQKKLRGYPLDDYSKKIIESIKKDLEGLKGKERDYRDYYHLGWKNEKLAKDLILDNLKSESGNFFALYVMKEMDKLDEDYYQEMSKILQGKDKKLQEKLLETILSRAKYRDDFKSAILTLENFDYVSPELKQKIKEMAPEMVPSFYRNPDLKDKDIKILANILGKEKNKLKKAMLFAKEIEGMGKSWEADKIDIYIKLAEKPEYPEYLDLLKQLNSYGIWIGPIEKTAEVLPEILAQKDSLLDLLKQLKSYGFEGGSIETIAEVLPEVSVQKDSLLDSLPKIKKDFPEFQYRELYYDYEEGKLINPYEILVEQTNLEDLLARLNEIQEKEKSFSPKYAEGLLLHLRHNDPLLRNTPKGQEISESTRNKFQEILPVLVREIFSEKGKLKIFRDFYTHRKALEFLARQPERIDELISLPETSPQLFKLLNEGGVLYSNRDLVINDIFSNGNLLQRVKEIETIFTKRVPYSEQLFLFTEVRVGDQLAAAESRYPITEILGKSLEEIIKEHRISKKQNPEKLTKLEGMIKNPEIIEKLVKGELKEVPFVEFNGMYKRLIMKDLLKESIEKSRDLESKERRDEKNRKEVEKELKLSDGTYIHASPIGVIESVLLSGNLPRELLGEGASTDAYPFHSDFTRLREEWMKEQGSTDKIFLNSLSGNYGADPELGINGQIFYVFKRDKDAYQSGKEYGPTDHQALVLGGYPSTEISAIVLRNPEKTLERAKKAVTENGFFIPIYNIEGKLLFSPQEYDSIREEFNLSVPVDDVWDYSLETGGQKGSNPAAEITVGGERGPEKYYVKFEYPESPFQVWQEKLAEDIYRKLKVPVPKTKVVLLTRGPSRVYGHASLLIEGEHKSRPEIQSLPSWKNGFIADALLANWDIPYAPERNVFVGKDGKVYRIDNGGALLFRARGQRKSKELFGEKVREIEVGKNRERLGLGMRQEYPGLTEKDIKTQVDLLKQLTDEKIDSLVERIRSPKENRERLKKTLKQRRDYIINYFSKK